MKIALVYLSQFMGISGGIERVLCNFSNAMIERGHEIAIIYSSGKPGQPFYPLNDEVKLYDLMLVHPTKWGKDIDSSVPIWTKIIRESVRIFSKSKARDWNENVKGQLIREDIVEILNQIQPDVILSARYEVSNYLLNIVKTHIPVITMFHTDANEAMPNMPKGELKALAKSAYAQVLMEKDIEVVRTYCPDARIVRIPNAVPQYDRAANLSGNKKRFKVINMARLARIKQQHLLIEAFSNVAEEFPNWTVELWGGDNERGYGEQLKDLIKKKQLQSQVFLKGKSNKVLDVYVGADLFVFPSKYEGFPLAMTEAMSAGLPVIAFRSCSSAAELIESGYNGLLTADGVKALSAGMRDLMKNQEKRVAIGRCAKESMKRYRPDNIWNQWEALLRKFEDSIR